MPFIQANLQSFESALNQKYSRLSDSFEQLAPSLLQRRVLESRGIFLTALPMHISIRT